MGVTLGIITLVKINIHLHLCTHTVNIQLLDYGEEYVLTFPYIYVVDSMKLNKLYDCKSTQSLTVTSSLPHQTQMLNCPIQMLNCLAHDQFHSVPFSAQALSSIAYTSEVLAF